MTTYILASQSNFKLVVVPLSDRIALLFVNRVSPAEKRKTV
jgi:hypothetical protein